VNGRVRDVLKALAFDDCTDSLGAKDTHLFGLLEHRLTWAERYQESGV
jgi:hypothetical protein